MKARREEQQRAKTTFLNTILLGNGTMNRYLRGEYRADAWDKEASRRLDLWCKGKAANWSWPPGHIFPRRKSRNDPWEDTFSRNMDLRLNETGDPYPYTGVAAGRDHSVAQHMMRRPFYGARRGAGGGGAYDKGGGEGDEEAGEEEETTFCKGGGRWVVRNPDIVGSWAFSLSEARDFDAVPHEEAQARAQINIDSIYAHIPALFPDVYSNSEEDTPRDPKADKADRDDDHSFVGRDGEEWGECVDVAGWELAGGRDNFFRTFTYFRNLRHGILVELDHWHCGAFRIAAPPPPPHPPQAQSPTHASMHPAQSTNGGEGGGGGSSSSGGGGGGGGDGMHGADRARETGGRGGGGGGGGRGPQYVTSYGSVYGQEDMMSSWRCPAVVDAFEAAAEPGEASREHYVFDKNVSDKRWHTPDEIEEGLTSQVVVWPGSSDARRLLAKLAYGGLVLRDQPLICKPLVTPEVFARAGKACGEVRDRAGEGMGSRESDEASAGDSNHERDNDRDNDRVYHSDCDNGGSGELAVLSLFPKAGQAPANRPPYTNNGWELQVVRSRACMPVGGSKSAMARWRGDEAGVGIGEADACTDGGKWDYIRVRHRDDPEAVLFLYHDGLLLYGCDDPINRWRGAGVTLLSKDNCIVRAVSRHQVLGELQRLGMQRELPQDLHLYKLRLVEENPVEGSFDPENPPPWAVYYRNFKNRAEPGFWGEYQHHEDQDWQEYVLRCWDEESLSVEDSEHPTRFGCVEFVTRAPATGWDVTRCTHLVTSQGA